MVMHTDPKSATLPQVDIYTDWYLDRENGYRPKTDAFDFVPAPPVDPDPVPVPPTAPEMAPEPVSLPQPEPGHVDAGAPDALDDWIDFF